MKILLVEDDDIAMLVLTKMIARLGHASVCCSDGQQALERIDDTIDLVITDWMLPKVTGPELIEILNQKPGKSTPVLLMSGMPDEILTEKGKDVGADGILSKPYTLDVLSAKIKELA